MIFFLISVESFPFAIYSFQKFQIVLNLFTNYWLTKYKYKMSLKVWFLPLLQFYGWNINSSGEIRNQILLFTSKFLLTCCLKIRNIINRGKYIVRNICVKLVKQQLYFSQNSKKPEVINMPFLFDWWSIHIYTLLFPNSVEK